eukprot:109957-Prymnesium_polylepis.1
MGPYGAPPCAPSSVASRHGVKPDSDSEGVRVESRCPSVSRPRHTSELARGRGIFECHDN